MSRSTQITLHEASRRAAESMGVKLFTASLIAPGHTETARIFSSNELAYPVGGRKTLDPSQTAPLWAERVLHGQIPFVGVDKEAISAFFFDHEIIFSLGCGSIINTPVVLNGHTIGSINFLAGEHELGKEHVAEALAITEAVTDEVFVLRSKMFGEEV